MTDGPASAPFAVVAFGVDDEAALAAHLAIRNAVTPDNPDSPDSVRWETATYPGQVHRFLALDADGAPVGTASTGRIWMHEASYERYWLGLWVLPAARRRGIGQALYEAVSEAAHARGKTGFQTELSEAHLDGTAFLAHRGFVEVDRTKLVRLDVGGLQPPTPAIPDGLTLTTLEARPDLVAGVHRVAVEAFPDIPTGDEPVAALSLEEFRARDVDRADVPPGAFALIVDDASGEVAGYANLRFAPGSTTLAWHDMTAVRPSFRGRGLALALKQATIAWAIANGVEALETGNDEHNAPMRAVNARLGYRPIPDSVGLQGPLAGGSGILRP
jgi:GNAT superfamily N-acetyltransferase